MGFFFGHVIRDVTISWREAKGIRQADWITHKRRSFGRSFFSDFNSWKTENVSKVFKSDSYMLSKSFGGDLLRSGLTR